MRGRSSWRGEGGRYEDSGYTEGCGVRVGTRSLVNCARIPLNKSRQQFI